MKNLSLKGEYCRYKSIRQLHRRRLKIEEKAKVVASVLGEEFIKFLVALAVLLRTNLNNRMNCTMMICKKIVLGKIASAARN